jgi:hypothetical protein
VYRIATLIFFSLFLATAAPAQGVQEIKVNPTGVNVNAHGATTAFLTYGQLRNYRAAEACWAGELIAATPDIGFKPDPATLFGCLPARYDRSTASGNLAYTDVMSIPPSVARRAYQDAARGAESRFFYVRRFVSLTGAPDQYVVVTCRMTGGGARSLFSLTDVKVAFDSGKTVMLVKAGETLPRVQADITYTGTGRLKGRWEVVLPGEVLPSETDLVTEATLPVERRSAQRRYTQLSRFNVFLPPTGRYTLPGPETAKLPNRDDGPYLILLRVEATDDREADSDLAAVGAGTAVVHSGAVAGFPLPPLRYYVGSGVAVSPVGVFALLTPTDNHTQAENVPLDFIWSADARAVLYRLEVSNASGQIILSALLASAVTTYRAPSWLPGDLRDGGLRWRVLALDGSGNPARETAWRHLQLTKTVR